MEAVFNVFKKCTIVAILILLSSLSVICQNELQQGDEAFRLFKYEEAIQMYEKHLLNKDDNAVRVKLVDALMFTSQYQKAEVVLEKLLLTHNDGHAMLKYANVLVLNDKKSKASSILQDYIRSFPSSDEYKRLFEIVQLKNDQEDKQFKTLLSKSAFSSDVSDFSPVYYGSQIIFTSQKGGKIDPWTGKSFTNLYITDENKSNPVMLDGNLNGKFHNGACTFMDNETMVFTRNNSKKGANSDYNLILAIATKVNEKWNFKQEMPFNSKDFSNGYPTYIPSQKILIFSSDRPGGFGGMDLYYSKSYDGKWADPINFGSDVNTKGNEVFSTYDGTNLFFSSDGRPGYGGLDIFKASIIDANISTIENVGSTINSARDDFGLITKDNMQSGYFSSNTGGNGDKDNIWYFEKRKIQLPPQKILINGKVIDEFTKLPLKETSVVLKNTLNGEEFSIITKDDGRFSFEAISEQNYSLTGSKNGILTSSEIITKANTSDTYYFTLLHNDPRFSLEGFAIKTLDKKGVQGVSVICFNKTKNIEESIVTDENGFFKFQLDQNADYEISGTKDGYYTSVSEASTKGLNRSQTLYVKLFLTIEEVIIGETKILGKESIGSFTFEPIFYDLDKADIRPDATVALDKVVDFMNKNPKLTIELGSHTDSRSSDSYNDGLSQRRAQSAVQYIVSKGVSQNRITAKGYGETKLVNHCSDGVKCNDDLHQQNRRTEIKITGYN